MQLVIEPHDTLLFRDAKEFASEAGSASTLAFPLPSVLAGAVRTRLGSPKGTFESSRREALLQTGVLSPFLVELDDDGAIKDWLLPAPSDAVVFQNRQSKDQIGGEVHPLFPAQWPQAATSDFTSMDLLPLTFEENVREKPLAGAPRFWSYKGSLCSWLVEAKRGPKPKGLSGPERETRIHVQIGAQGTAADRALFSTEMLRFATKEHRLALVALVDGQVAINGVFPLGGERRLARWRSTESAPESVPEGIRNSIRKYKKARLLLVTPGYFEEGVWRPQNLGEGVLLKAAALRGYNTASGWDLHVRQPKASRRLAPAGTVYFVELPQKWSDRQVDDWIDAHWFHSVADDVQSRRDGFGVALVGSWTKQLDVLGKGT